MTAPTERRYRVRLLSRYVHEHEVLVIARSASAAIEQAMRDYEADEEVIELTRLETTVELVEEAPEA